MVSLESLSLRRSMRLCRPRTPSQLRAYVDFVLGYRMPITPIVAGHSSPMDYLTHAFFEDAMPRDCVVWANRSGGKTQLGAIATLLDLLFKPGIQVRILAGSFEQSSKMYRYLKRFLEDDLFNDLLAGNLTGRFVELTSGSRVEVLAQSERAVRGQRVHRLRCDEVELFDDEIWDAAQYITRSGWCGETFVRGSIETLSTMHRSFGLMRRLVRDAGSARRVFHWGLLETLETCAPERACEKCPLWIDCGGRAKEAAGFVAIDDAIQQRERAGNASWNAEMLCIEPSRETNVYPEFDVKVHVTDAMEGILNRSSASHGPDACATDLLWIGGMDFGYRSPTVLLWAFVAGDVVHVVDEMHVEERTVEEHIMAAGARPWPRPVWIGADPAGHQRSEQSGLSPINIWKRHGWPIRTRTISLQDGLSAVRRRLLSPPVMVDGSPAHRVRLRIHPRCEALIKAMSMYHYPPEDERSMTPVKDGHDHAADALRYMIVNLDARSGRARVRGY